MANTPEIQNLGIGQNAVSEAVTSLVLDLPNFTGFTYLLTPDQFDRLTTCARQRKGVLPLNRGVRVDEDHAYHPVISRSKKDNLSPTLIADLLVGGYHKKSQIYPNPTYANQYYMLNEGKRSAYGYAMVTVEVVNKEQVLGGEEGTTILIAIAPQTAYWVGQAKLNGVKNTSLKRK